MNDSSHTIESGEKVSEDPVLSLARRLARSEAAHLARRGDYPGAEALLSDLLADADGSTLDLLARIRAQQGRYGEAEALWRDAAAVDPLHPEYRAGLARLARAHGRWTGRTGLLLWIVGALLLLLVLRVGWQASSELRSLRAGRDTDVVTVDQGGQNVADADARPTTQPGGGVPGEVDSPSPDLPTRRIGSLIPALNAVSGVDAFLEGEGITVRFEEGLFSHALTLLPVAEGLVREVCNRLEGVAGEIRVEVVGHTDSVPLREGSRFRDNRALGMARASLVGELLLALPGLGTDAVLARSAGPDQPPFPDRVANLQPRNRTVTLRISSEI